HLDEELHARMEVLLDLRTALAPLEGGQDPEVDLVQREEAGALPAAVDEGGVEGGIDVLDDPLVDVAFEGLFGEGLDLEEVEYPFLHDCDPGLFLQDHVDEHGFRHRQRHSRRSCGGWIACGGRLPGGRGGRNRASWPR